jgi:hypothetical protein
MRGQAGAALGEVGSLAAGPGDEIAERSDGVEAVIVDRGSRRRSRAQVRAQASEGALHADRRVQQYGLLLDERSARECRALGDWTVRGRGIELGVSYAADARNSGLTTTRER